jgi:hypothetical protein
MKVLLEKSQIENRIKEIGIQILNRHKDESTPIVLVCVLNGGFMFYTKLLDQLAMLDPKCDFIRVKSYKGREHEVPEIIIYPFGSKGGITKPFLIKSMNSKSFTNLELRWNANNLQSEYLRGEVKSGIGIYRLGHEKKIASYYLGNFKE